MDNPIFDLEQEIMDCWRVTEDVDMTTRHFVDSPKWEGMDPKLCDALMNKYFGIKELYELKFDKLWNTFEKVCKEYHERGQRLNIDWTDDLDISFADDCLPNIDVSIGDEYERD